MFAVILAGGAGTRLRPLTYARRKELVPVLDRPLLEYRLTNLRDHGVRNIVLACAQGTQEIEQRFGNGAALEVSITYVYEDRPLGSGRAVKEAARAAGAMGTVVVCNGDILTNIDLTSMIQQHRWTGAAMSMSLAPVDDPWNFGVVAVDDELRITRFVEKPAQGEQPSNLINAGTWIWEREVLARIPDDDSAVRDQFAERVLFPGMIAGGLRIQGFTEDLWVDVGSPERYVRANRLLLERAVAELATSVIAAEGARIDAGARFEGEVYVGGGAEVVSGARVVGLSVIGAKAAIERDAVVERSVIWEAARIGARATVTDSIIGGGVRIGAGASVRDAVIADGAVVGEGHALERGARLMPDERAPATSE
jgi:mannose-1-phosphate guanylyltransferase